MQLLKVIEEIEKIDPELYQDNDNRRNAIKKFGNFSAKVALTALPFALGGLFEKAYGNPPATSSVIGVLNFALTLEFLESGFYQNGLAAGSSLIPSAEELQGITIIANHEAEHVAFLQGAIKALGGTPISKPTFDYTAGGGSGNGPFKGLFGDWETFLAVAQTFEDTGVRAYKGQAPALVQGGAYLTAALDIHSVEARHAAHIREMRLARNFGDVKPWITLNQSGIGGAAGAVVQPSYNGEDNTVQAGIQTVNIDGYDISVDAASEAFDEPLTTAQVLAIVTPFFA